MDYFSATYLNSNQTHSTAVTISHNPSLTEHGKNATVSESTGLWFFFFFFHGIRRPPVIWKHFKIAAPEQSSSQKLGKEWQCSN